MVNPLVLVAAGLTLGMGLVVAARRRGGNRSVEITRYALAALGVALVVVDLFTAPAHRWADGIILAIVVLIWVVAIGYVRLRSSRTHPTQ